MSKSIVSTAGTTEISNGLESDLLPLSDVADLLQGGSTDPIKARILNRVKWFPIDTDGSEQFDNRKLIRATGYEGGPDARIWADIDLASSVAERQPLWDVKVGETETICFRRWMQGGREVLGALWVYWESDLPEMVEVYRADLDVDAAGDEAVKYIKSRMFSDLLHVPMYDDEGFVLLKSESALDARECFDAGIFEVDAADVVAYKAQVTSAECTFASEEDAAEYRRSLEPIRVKSDREKAAIARRKDLPGAPVGAKVVAQGRQVPARPASKRASRVTPVVRVEEPARKGVFARLFGR